MIYEYHCERCDKNFDVHKHHDQHRRQEYCPQCKAIGIRRYRIARPIIDKTSAEYYPSLGTVVKSKSHRKELMKIHNLEEVGNETSDTIHKEANKTLESNKAKKKEEWDREWDKVIQETK